MTRSEELETALASVDIHTYDDWNGARGHVAIIVRDGQPYLTGAHDNEDNSYSDYDRLLPVKPDQDFEAALGKIDDLKLSQARGLFYYFPQTMDVLRDLAKAIGLLT